jgi:hypothetical protein
LNVRHDVEARSVLHSNLHGVIERFQAPKARHAVTGLELDGTRRKLEVCALTA